MKEKKAVTLTVKQFVALLYKKFDHDLEVFIKVKEDDLIGTIKIPLRVKDVKIEELEDDEKVVVIDLS